MPPALAGTTDFESLSGGGWEDASVGRLQWVRLPAPDRGMPSPDAHGAAGEAPPGTAWGLPSSCPLSLGRALSRGPWEEPALRPALPRALPGCAEGLGAAGRGGPGAHTHPWPLGPPLRAPPGLLSAESPPRYHHPFAPSAPSWGGGQSPRAKDRGRTGAHSDPLPGFLELLVVEGSRRELVWQALGTTAGGWKVDRVLLGARRRPFRVRRAAWGREGPPRGLPWLTASSLMPHEAGVGWAGGFGRPRAAGRRGGRRDPDGLQPHSSR